MSIFLFLLFGVVMNATSSKHNVQRGGWLVDICISGGVHFIQSISGKRVGVVS